MASYLGNWRPARPRAGVRVPCIDYLAGMVPVLPVSPAALAGGASPVDFTLTSLVVVVEPVGELSVSVVLTFDSSPQPTKPKLETAPRIIT